MPSENIISSMLIILTTAMVFTLACEPGLESRQLRKAKDRTMERHEMVKRQIMDRGITNQAVLEAMRRVPRHKFVLDMFVHEAYEDYPLPIEYGQTISQPYIVAYMTEALELQGHEKVLEIGTGSGYQAAVLTELAAEVFTIEIVEPLATPAAEILKKTQVR